MITINSLSGGKTSSYMALHYPADINIFACVLTNDRNCIPKDKGLLREAQNKIPWFTGSRELDVTLKAVLDLEQLMGREITWVASQETFDEIIARKQYLPNARHRFCTVELKIKPIIYWLYSKVEFPVLMNIGFRYDEKKRVDNWNCKNDKFNGIEWRVTRFPLYEDKITKDDITHFWENKSITFPTVSNCDFCFFHTSQEIIQQTINYPERLNWWLEQERATGRLFKPLKDKTSCYCHD